LDPTQSGENLSIDEFEGAVPFIPCTANLDSPHKKDAIARRFCQIDCCIGVDHSNAVLNTLSTPIFKSSSTHSAFGNKPNSFDSPAWF